MDTESKIYAMGTYRFASVVSFGSLSLAGGEQGRSGPHVCRQIGFNGPRHVERHSRRRHANHRSFGNGLGRFRYLVAGSVGFGNLSLNGVGPGWRPDLCGQTEREHGRVVWIAGVGAGGNLRVSAIAEGANGTILLTGNYFLAAKLGASPMPAPNTQGGLFRGPAPI